MSPERDDEVSSYNEDHDLVFANQAGGPLDWRVVAARHFRPLLKKAELSGFRPYDLRHTQATLLLREGVNVKVVSERLGHKDVNIAAGRGCSEMALSQGNLTLGSGGGVDMNVLMRTSWRCRS